MDTRAILARPDAAFGGTFADDAERLDLRTRTDRTGARVVGDKTFSRADQRTPGAAALRWRRLLQKLNGEPGTNNTGDRRSRCHRAFGYYGLRCRAPEWDRDPHAVPSAE